MSVLNISQIMEILPHRQPMLLIDSVEEIEYGVRAVAKKCVSFNEPFFAGHFPQECRVPLSASLPAIHTLPALPQ